MIARGVIPFVVLGAVFSATNTLLVQAADGGLLNYAMAAKKSYILSPPWISQLGITNASNRNLDLADGNRFMSLPRVVRSGYDQSAIYDVSHFYRAKRPRLNAVFHYGGRQVGEIISAGLDTGFRAEKIELQPALFFGYTRAIQLKQKSSYFAFSAGGWVGGKVTEKACRDSYQREYYCPTLTAWVDYRQPKPNLHRYVRFLFRHEF